MYRQIRQTGGGNCSLCGAPETNKTNCPWNSDAKNPNPQKHNPAPLKPKPKAPAKPKVAVAPAPAKPKPAPKALAKPAPKIQAPEPIPNPLPKPLPKPMKPRPTQEQMRSRLSLLFSSKDTINIVIQGIENRYWYQNQWLHDKDDIDMWIDDLPPEIENDFYNFISLFEGYEAVYAMQVVGDRLMSAGKLSQWEVEKRKKDS